MYKKRQKIVELVARPAVPAADVLVKRFPDDPRGFGVVGDSDRVLFRPHLVAKRDRKEFAMN